AALLRLAALEYQRGNVSRTADLLRKTIAVQSPEPDARLDDQIAHLWVQVHLDLARDAGPDDRDDLLKSAASHTRRPGDILRVELALMDLDAARVGITGAVERALTLLRRIGESPADLDAGLTALGWVSIKERLDRLWADARDDDRLAINRAIESALAGVTDR